MIVFSKVDSTAAPEFASCLSIYESSFPLAERQPVERIVSRVDTGACELYCLSNYSKPIGMAVLWNFNGCNIMFLDYFAIATTYRGKGFGRELLRQISTRVSINGKSLGLEIEHPHFGYNVDERLLRLRFYTSNGAKVLANVPYAMPALHQSGEIEMLLLLFPKNNHASLKAEIEKFISNLYKHVYLLQRDHSLVCRILSSIPTEIKLSDTL